MLFHRFLFRSFVTYAHLLYSYTTDLDYLIAELLMNTFGICLTTLANLKYLRGSLRVQYLEVLCPLKVNKLKDQLNTKKLQK